MMVMMINTSQLHLLSPVHSVLNQPSGEVGAGEIHSSEIQGVINRMLQMSAGKGKTKEDSRQMVGLAAPQLGIRKRIVMIDMTADGSNQEQRPQIFINPVIVRRSKETGDGREGCWSCGNICGNVERSKDIILKALTREGTVIEHNLAGFVARIAQHEVDHLDGIRFPDRIPTDQPERLHWVEPTQFDAYRNKWENWPILCSRERWAQMKGQRAS